MLLNLSTFENVVCCNLCCVCLAGRSSQAVHCKWMSGLLWAGSLITASRGVQGICSFLWCGNVRTCCHFGPSTDWSGNFMMKATTSFDHSLPPEQILCCQFWVIWRSSKGQPLVCFRILRGGSCLIYLSMKWFISHDSSLSSHIWTLVVTSVELWSLYISLPLRLPTDIWSLWQWNKRLVTIIFIGVSCLTSLLCPLPCLVQWGLSKCIHNPFMSLIWTSIGIKLSHRWCFILAHAWLLPCEFWLSIHLNWSHCPGIVFSLPPCWVQYEFAAVMLMARFWVQIKEKVPPSLFAIVGNELIGENDISGCVVIHMMYYFHKRIAFNKSGCSFITFNQRFFFQFHWLDSREKVFHVILWNWGRMES